MPGLLFAEAVYRKLESWQLGPRLHPTSPDQLPVCSHSPRLVLHPTLQLLRHPSSPSQHPLLLLDLPVELQKSSSPGPTVLPTRSDPLHQSSQTGPCLLGSQLCASQSVLGPLVASSNPSDGALHAVCLLAQTTLHPSSLGPLRLALRLGQVAPAPPQPLGELAHPLAQKADSCLPTLLPQTNHLRLALQGLALLLGPRNLQLQLASCLLEFGDAPLHLCCFP
mmetsp:Transcript_1397/g.2950  ORF Transcript_1397/g.2950 Transcript_1397/m.2950 type:complete len:223 (-) Transcript_1397:141-809(-)